MSELNICSLSDDHVVEKSRPLVLAKEMPYSIAQFKLVETYLSLINPRDIETTTRVFRLQDYLDLLGLKQIKMKNLKDNLSGLISIQIVVPLDNYKKGFLITNLFESAVVEEDEAYGWLIKMKCSETAQKILFDIKDINYIKYILRNTIFMSSSYSMLLYQYLRYNLFRGKWLVPVNELRDNHLRATSSTYTDFMRFNEMILKPCVDEVNKKSDIKVKYKTVFVNGRVQSIEFTATEKEEDPMEYLEQRRDVNEYTEINQNP